MTDSFGGMGSSAQRPDNPTISDREELELVALARAGARPTAVGIGTPRPASKWHTTRWDEWHKSNVTDRMEPPWNHRRRVRSGCTPVRSGRCHGTPQLD